MTNFLIAINVLVFWAGLMWQSKPGHNVLALLNAGGLIGTQVVAGEWWRIVTANFLHLDLLHLAMNMFALMYLGKFVEHSLGTFRFSLAYIISGLGSMLVITYVDTKWITTPQVTVGASGAIMGLLGVMGAIHLVGWHSGRAKSAARELRVVLFSVGFQLVFDLINGHTSIVGHFSGLTIGFFAGLVLLSFGRRY